MKITVRPLDGAANASSARGTTFRELRNLLLSTVLLLAVVYLAIAFIVDVSVKHMSFESEASLFGSVPVPMELADSHAEALTRVDAILETLLEDPDVPALPYSLAVVDGDRPNAFAFPGGSIGFSEAMLDELDDEMAIAFTLGHELGHFRNRDHLRGFGRVAGVTVAYALIFGRSSGDQSLSSAAFFVLDRQYSQGQEEQADLFALNLINRVYGETSAFENLFSLLEEHDDIPDWAYMFATHPSPRTRIERLRAEARRLSSSPSGNLP